VKKTAAFTHIQAYFPSHVSHNRLAVLLASFNIAITFSVASAAVYL